MKTIIRRIGNNQGIILPKDILKAVNWSENETVSLDVEGDRIVIRKAESKTNIAELFENYDGDYESQEMDWGSPVGKEKDAGF